MKKILLPCFLLTFIGFQSCTNPGGKTADKNDTTIYDQTRPAGKFYLEDLLNIKNEAELKQKYGAEHVKYDTIWGEEGNFGFGTYLDKGTKDEVQLIWKDSLRTQGVTSAMAIASFDKDGNATFDNKWESNKGVKIGMTSDELEKVNGKVFEFSGFDWDYGGAVTDWKKGNLENSGVGVDLTIGLKGSELPEKDYDKILGDQNVSSDNVIVQKVKPQVIKLSVYKP